MRYYLFLMLLVAPCLTAQTERGHLPPLAAIVGVCQDAKFSDRVCNPFPDLAPLIGIPQATLADGNLGSFAVSVIGIRFASALNEEHFTIPYETITGICADHTAITDIRDVRNTTLIPARHYFRITGNERDVIFWIPGGTRDTNNVALFYHAVFRQILPVADCTLRPKE